VDSVEKRLETGPDLPIYIKVLLIVCSINQTNQHVYQLFYILALRVASNAGFYVSIFTSIQLYIV
jgi:hypothetical protein